MPILWPISRSSIEGSRQHYGPFGSATRTPVRWLRGAICASRSRMQHDGAAQIPGLAPRPSRAPGAEAAGGELAVQFLTSTEEFARLAPEWNRLHSHAKAASVF